MSASGTCILKGRMVSLVLVFTFDNPCPLAKVICNANAPLRIALASIFFVFCVRIMAKQAGPIKISGTISEICFYQLYEEYYARRKSTLSGKRVKKDPAFKETMHYAELLAVASKIASAIYSKLPSEQKSRKKYQAMTGKAMQLLKNETDMGTIFELLSHDIDGHK